MGSSKPCVQLLGWEYVMKLLTGYILARPGGSHISRDELSLNHSSPTGQYSLQFDQPSDLGSPWDLFDFASSTPLPNDAQDPGAEPVHSCQAIICRSQSRMLFLAERKKYAEFIIENLLSVALFPNFRKVPILIDHFIDACAAKDGPFAITSMHGRFAGHERSLRTIILFGDEVTDSSFFRNQRALFNFYSAGVRKRSEEKSHRSGPFEDSEIARIGNDGLLSANFADKNRAGEVLRVVKYIFDNKWVDHWARREPD